MNTESSNRNPAASPGKAAASPERESRARRFAALGDPSRLAIVDSLLLSDRSPSELGSSLGIPSNRLAHHLDVLQRAGLLDRRVSDGDGRRRYLRLLPGSLEGLWSGPVLQAQRVLFICRHNSARSQYASAYWNRAARIPATSAGVEPADRVHPLAVAAAARRGLDLRSLRPRGYDEVEFEPSLVISVCDLALESEPPFAPLHRLHWSLPDPARANDPADFESAFDRLEERIDRLVDCIAPMSP